MYDGVLLRLCSLFSRRLLFVDSNHSTDEQSVGFTPSIQDPAGDIHVWVYCQMISDGRDEDTDGWTVIQRRMDGSIHFYQPWGKYKRGFGTTEGEYWLGPRSTLLICFA
ncbi:hypothetical protein Q8A67_005383 [Cirrhinus molitorella]|uniref:Fibrinogen C-terminal domain-containing protein n=1 Tax=Cirrhinus molitorella TaxID=172907 RepID=A0AA88PZM3_9TELE|nr:hypothetical protein Q8A67_005383 [Cirrhinus molitorella]